MKPPGWHPALLLTLLFWPGWILTQEEKIQAVDVSISGTSVILTCPLGSDTNKPNKITLKHKNSIFDHKEEKPFTLQNFDESNNGLYECTVSYEGNVPPLKAKLYLKAKGYSKERPPPVPNPDYEPLKKGQREVYDGLNSRGY
uniref:T-cell surface glycoprotein CD3 epsilon chain n=1 Tax=Geotrypetes seraphini TaxID=260995 RepID=A0A6P8PKL7_GEOSA|nr:T-cell surface glycoprotein CD3 epsilon chain isoform X3 [Geotrypetes seraphini]